MIISLPLLADFSLIISTEIRLENIAGVTAKNFYSIIYTKLLISYGFSALSVSQVQNVSYGKCSLVTVYC